MATEVSAPQAPLSSPRPAAPLSGTTRLVGTYRLPGVRVQEWTVRGSAKVVGSVEVDTAVLRGTTTIGGTLTARRLEASGVHRIEGELRVTEELRTRGTLRAGGGLTAGTARFVGRATVGRSLAVPETLEWTGALEVGQDVDAGSVLFRGSVVVPGRMHARSISGEVDRLSHVGTLSADWIELRGRKGFPPFPIFLLPPPPWRELVVQRIEATEVHLSCVRVHHLKADRIWLGPNAHVQYVEGTILERHKDAHVGPESESSPPPGLSR
jgi:hypothetical protein